MRNLSFWMAVATVITGASVMSGCGGVKRTKFTDPRMRVIIDADSIDTNNYVRIEQALVASEKWVVLDRALAYAAIKKEQERQHRSESDRFSDPEKWAIWGRMLGAGSVIVAHTQCTRKETLFHVNNYLHCQQFLEIVNSNTTEVIAAVENEQNGDNNEYSLAPSWEDTVDALNDAYPKHYVENKDDKILWDYRDLASAEAQKQKEVVDAQKAKEAEKQNSEVKLQ